MKPAGTIAKWVALSLVSYVVLVVVMAIGFMAVVAAYRDTRGTVIVPVYIALHLVVRLLVFFGLGFAVGRQSTDRGLVGAAAAGLVLAVVLMALEVAVGNIFALNELIPSVYYLALVPLIAVGVAVLGARLAARRSVAG